MEKRARDIDQGGRIRFNVRGRRKRGERSPQVFVGREGRQEGGPGLGVLRWRSWQGLQGERSWA